MSKTRPPTENDIKHIARLARLQVDESDLAELTQDIQRILAYVSKLEELDTASIPATTHAVALSNDLREDIPKASLATELGLRCAPEPIQGGFGVPQIIGTKT